jgi:hypothetical protein
VVNSFAVETVVLDMDSTEIPVYGQQEQSAYNGHFESTCSLERDIAELSSVPVQRGQAVAERNRLQPREPVAATGAAD